MLQNQSDNLLTPDEAANRLGITRHTLNNWRKNKTINLPFVRIGRLVKYRQSDVEAFIASNVQNMEVSHG